MPCHITRVMQGECEVGVVQWSQVIKVMYNKEKDIISIGIYCTVKALNNEGSLHFVIKRQIVLLRFFNWNFIMIDTFFHRMQRTGKSGQYESQNNELSQFDSVKGGGSNRIVSLQCLPDLMNWMGPSQLFVKPGSSLNPKFYGVKSKNFSAVKNQFVKPGWFVKTETKLSNQSSHYNNVPYDDLRSFVILRFHCTTHCVCGMQYLCEPTHSHTHQSRPWPKYKFFSNEMKIQNTFFFPKFLWKWKYFP